MQAASAMPVSTAEVKHRRWFLEFTVRFLQGQCYGRRSPMTFHSSQPSSLLKFGIISSSEPALIPNDELVADHSLDRCASAAASAPDGFAGSSLRGAPTAHAI